MVLVFLLPTESGERLGYSLTIFLSFTIVLTITSDLMPTTSKEIPIIGKRYTACADPKGNGGFRSPSHFPLEKHKTTGFLSNTGPDPLENLKASKPALNVRPISARQRSAI